MKISAFVTNAGRHHEVSVRTDKLEQLLKVTDGVAEIHNTVRAPIEVTLVPWETGV